MQYSPLVLQNGFVLQKKKQPVWNQLHVYPKQVMAFCMPLRPAEKLLAWIESLCCQQIISCFLLDFMNSLGY